MATPNCKEGCSSQALEEGDQRATNGSDHSGPSLGAEHIAALTKSGICCEQRAEVGVGG